MIHKNKYLGTLLGDSYISKKSFRTDHCPEQLDYLNHIADLFRSDFNKNVSVYYRVKRNIHCLCFHDSVFESWRSQYYPDNKKSLINILSDVTDPVMAVAYWLMDDGCIHFSTKNKNYLSPRFLLATCAESKETHEWMIKWFTDNLGITPYITIQNNHKRQKSWALLKFSVGDSYKLWQKVRHLIISLPSMKHKFQIPEQEFRLEFYKIKYSHESSTSFTRKKKIYADLTYKKQE